ncbi:hypothetical protein PINS_up005471 [Pythium insidiosum]|nr:hypothetical protein PINS_up005471 [Pythium insidiosum]
MQHGMGLALAHAREASARRLRGGFAPNGALVSLPRPSPLVEALCVALYVLLALVAAWSLYRRRRLLARDRQPRKQSFQSFMIAFGATRALSFLTRDLARDLLNRLALCLFFSLVLFQVLFWIDIANPKRSTRSRRIWNAFLVANAGFYAMLLGMSALHSLQLHHETDATHTPLERIAEARAFDLGPVLFIALGSLASSLGLVYSTCKTRRRIGRVLRHTAAKARQLPRRLLYDRVTSKLQRALRVTNLIMGVCSVLFLLRTVLYIQRPFSHKECGAIRDPNACILIGYGLPELVPCFLFLLLMAQVEPDLELPSRRKSSLNVAAVARATESTPLLLAERDPELVIETSLRVTVDDGDITRPVTRSHRPSPLSSALGSRVIERVRRRLRRVLEDSFWLEVGGRVIRVKPRSVRLLARVPFSVSDQASVEGDPSAKLS